LNRETPEDEQRSGEIPIPAEEHLREARSAFDRWSRRMTLRIQRLLPRRWRENPMLLRETGLVEGRAFWRSPLVIAAAAALVSVCDHWFVRFSFLFGADGFNEWIRGHLWLWRVVGLLSSILPLWFCACAIARDREPSMRDQLASSPLTLNQILDAKVRVWLWVLIAMVLLNQVVLELIVDIGALLGPEDSRWRRSVGLGDPDVSVAVVVLFALLNLTLTPLISLSHHVFRIALTARLTLAWFNAPLSAALAFFIGWGLWSGPSWMIRLTMLAGGGFPTSLSIIWSAVQWTIALVVLVLAIALWRGLPRHFARVYGLAGDDRERE
jgi:hypothetical protein